MVIAYDKRDGAATFAALAAMLENYARLAEKTQADNGDTSASAIERCVAAMPDTEPLCTTFGEAIECADNAHDEELKADLTKLARTLTECWAQSDIGAYVTLLRRQAAYFQAVSGAIGANGTRTAGQQGVPTEEIVNAAVKSIRQDLDAIRSEINKDDPHTPPSWKDIKDDTWKRKTYDLLKAHTKKGGTLAVFLKTNKHTYKGWAPSDIFEDEAELREFERAAYNKYVYRA